MRNKTFFVAVALIAVWCMGYLILYFPIYPAFQYPVETIEDLEDIYQDRSGIIFLDFASFNLSQANYIVTLDGRSKISKKIGYTIDGEHNLLGSETFFSLTCRKSKNGIHTNNFVTYRDFVIYTEVHASRVVASVWLGGYQYQSDITSPSPSAFSQNVKIAATELLIGLSKNLVDTQYEKIK